jgi:hypothetical protein
MVEPRLLGEFSRRGVSVPNADEQPLRGIEEGLLGILASRRDA